MNATLPISEVDFKEAVWILIRSDGDAGSMIDSREVSYVVWVQKRYRVRLTQFWDVVPYSSHIYYLGRFVELCASYPNNLCVLTYSKVLSFSKHQEAR